MKTDPKARQRAALILQVRAGKLTATQAAQQLGVSRKTYYQWERRALEGMIQGLSEQAPGRPSKMIDPEKQALEKRLQKAEQELEAAKKLDHMKEIFQALESAPFKKRTRSSKQ